MKEQTQGSEKSFILPVAGLVVLLLIGSAIYFKDKPLTSNGDEQVAGTQMVDSNDPLSIIPVVTVSDHIRGDINAPIKIVEYSDLECPYCKVFHQNLNQVFEQYKSTNKLAWAFRQFPLEGLHEKARKEAEATECAGELGGDDIFWSYLDKIYEITPSNDGLDLAQLPIMAKDLGLDQKSFEACLASEKYTEKIDSQINEATLSGGTGTPYPIIILDSPTKADLSVYEDQPAKLGSEAKEGPISVNSDRTRIVLKGALPAEIIADIVGKILAN